MPLTQESYNWLTVNSLVTFIKTVKGRKKKATIERQYNSILYSNPEKNTSVHVV